MQGLAARPPSLRLALPRRGLPLASAPVAPRRSAVPRRCLPRRSAWALTIVAALAILGLRIPGPPPAGADIARDALTRLQTIPTRIRVIGYQRSQFGDGWATTITEQGHLCTTRQAVLLAAFPRDAAATPPASSGGSPATRSASCPAPGPKGIDAYTGEVIAPTNTDIDHVYPLAAAWDFGAHSWTPAQRRAFANDMERNLVVTASKVNRDKSDATLAGWLPPAPAAQCPYVARFLTVAVDYHLAISEADVSAAKGACAL